MIEIKKHSNNISEKDSESVEISLEDVSGINFLFDNATLACTDCIDMINELVEFGIDLTYLAEDIESAYKDLIEHVSIIETATGITDDLVESAESKYNGLLSIQKEVSRLYINYVVYEEETEEKTTAPAGVERAAASNSLEINDIEIATSKADVEEVVSLDLSALTKKNKFHNKSSKVQSTSGEKFKPSKSASNTLVSLEEESGWFEYFRDLGLDKNDFKSLERELESRVLMVEERSSDFVSRWLGEVQANTFDFLKDLTANEIIALAQAEGLRRELQVNNIKYETFVEWVSILSEIQSYLGQDVEHEKFGKLFTIYVIDQV